jgi:hypothetical protein
MCRLFFCRYFTFPDNFNDILSRLYRAQIKRAIVDLFIFFDGELYPAAASALLPVASHFQKFITTVFRVRAKNFSEFPERLSGRSETFFCLTETHFLHLKYKLYINNN